MADKPSLPARVDVLERILEEVRETMHSIGGKVDGVRDGMATREQVARLEQELRTVAAEQQQHSARVRQVPKLARRVRSLEDDRLRARTVLALAVMLAGGAGALLSRVFQPPQAPVVQVSQTPAAPPFTRSK